MIKFFRNRGLIGKITLIITCMLIIPTTVTCVFYYLTYEKSLLKEANNNLVNDLGQVESTMNTNLDMVQDVINELDYSQEFAYFLDSKSELNESEINNFLESIQNEVINIRYTYPNMFYDIKIYTSNQQISTKNNWKFGLYPMEDKGDLAQIEKSDVKMQYGIPKKPQSFSLASNNHNFQVIEDGSFVLPAYLYVRNLNSRKLIGIVEVDMLLEKLVDDRTLLEQSGDTKYLLLNNNKEILYQTGQFKGESFANVNFSDNSDTISTTINGETYLLAYSKCERSNLTVVALIPQRSVLKFMSNMIFRVTSVAIVGIICIIAATYWIIKRLLNRMVVLDEAMGKIGTGCFDVVVEDDGYNDEVSRIKKKFNEMTSQLRNAIRAMIEKEKAQKDAELRALQAQVNPHFLYNTLESMRMQCEIDGYLKIGNCLSSLGGIFRYTTKWATNEVQFHMEWKNLENYISIMKLRFEDDFCCNMDYEECVREIIVPKMLLQPIIENSFKHGFKGSLPPWRIFIQAKKVDDSLLIVIEDNGSGISEERLKEIQECLSERKPLLDSKKKYQSIGIINVMQRMDMICERGSSIKINNRSEGGVQIKIRIVIKEVT